MDEQKSTFDFFGNQLYFILYTALVDTLYCVAWGMGG